MPWREKRHIRYAGYAAAYERRRDTLRLACQRARYAMIIIAIYYAR